MGEGVNLVNPAYETAVELRRLLSEQGIANDGKTKDGEEKYQFYVSDAAEKFMPILFCHMTLSRHSSFR